MARSFTVFSRFFSTSHSRNNVINHVTIVGGGLMGSGIAQVTAQSGMDVTIVEVNEEAIKKCDANIKSSIQRVAKKLFHNNSSEAEKYISESTGRLKISLDLNETVSKTDLIIEAIVENLDEKQKLFSKVDSIAPDHTIFASNTSSLPISEIAAVTTRKDRFAGLHFFNPVPVMKLLEVIRTNETSDETYQKVLTWGKAIGKTTITCKDTPGFVVNRLLIPYLADAIRMLERGDANAKDIDIAMKLGAGYPMGPLELLDYVGLDTTKFILDGWHKRYPNQELFSPIALLDKMVADGKFGKKSGEGFYSYKKHSGNHSYMTHLPYALSSHLKPIPEPAIVPPPMEAQKEINKPSLMKKVKFEKVESVESVPDYYQLAKIERMEKMKKLEKLKSLEKWKNSDEFVKTEREKPIVRRLSIIKRNKDTEPSRDLFKNEKMKNLEDFIKLERDRNSFLHSRNFQT